MTDGKKPAWFPNRSSGKYSLMFVAVCVFEGFLGMSLSFQSVLKPLSFLNLLYFLILVSMITYAMIYEYILYIIKYNLFSMI